MRSTTTLVFRWSSIALTTTLLGCHRTPTEDRNSGAQASTTLVASAGPPASVASKVDTAVPSLRDRLPRPLNVLMLSVDALRADMPWNGYQRPIAPNLTALSERSVLYTHAYSISSYTAQSVAAMLSGRFASTLYRAGYFFTSYPKANLFFPEELQENHIRTMGWFSHLYFGRGKGLDQGFDVWELVPGITFDPQTDNCVTSDKMYDLGKKILENPENTSGQFFAWSHWGDPHDVYIKHKESPDFGNKNRDRYDSEVWYTDHYLGKLLDWAKTQPWWSHTAVIITSDHGEAFGEHGQYRHAFEIWENLVQVPLMFFIPGVPPKRIDQRRTHIDLAPTIMDLLGQKPLEQFEGQSLLPEMLGEVPLKDRKVLALELTEDTNNPERRAVISGKYKLLQRGNTQNFSLFDLQTDPGESNDLSSKEPERLLSMKKLFETTFAAIPSIRPYGGMKLASGRIANGPVRPPKPANTDVSVGNGS